MGMRVYRDKHEKEAGQSLALGSRPPGAWLGRGVDPVHPLEARPSPVPLSKLLDTGSALKK